MEPWWDAYPGFRIGAFEDRLSGIWFRSRGSRKRVEGAASVEHELDRQLGYLRAALEQDRRPLALLLGAGAPLAVRVSGNPVIPAIEGLTQLVRTDVRPEDRALVNQCLDDLSVAGEPPATIEHLLDYLRRISAIPGSEPVRGLTHGEVEEADAAVCSVIRSKLDVELPGTRTPYHDVAIWSQAALRHAPLEIFTTNYDLLLEQAFDATGVPYFDGFVGSHRPSFDVHAVEEDQLPNRWVRLWKLHGSINWSMATDGLVRRCFPSDGTERTLIYPSHLKYDQSRRLPYLALLDRLRAFLRQPGAVVVACGFSFRDAHINDIVVQALKANPTAALLALQHEPLSAYTEGAELANGTANFSLLARDQGIIGTRAGAWSGGATFDLGNFSTFGTMLRDMVGVGVSLAAPAPTS